MGRGLTKAAEGSLLSALIGFFAIIAAANAQNLTVLSPKCQPLYTGIDDCNIGQVCAEIVGDHLSVVIDATGIVEDNRTSTCCIDETHICNMPFYEDIPQCQRVFEFEDLEVASVYDFMCDPGSAGTAFQVNGHAVVCCDTELGCDSEAPDRRRRRRRLEVDETLPICYEAMYFIDLGCD